MQMSQFCRFYFFGKVTQNCVGEMRKWLGKCSNLLGKWSKWMGKWSKMCWGDAPKVKCSIPKIAQIYLRYLHIFPSQYIEYPIVLLIYWTPLWLSSIFLFTGFTAKTKLAKVVDTRKFLKLCMGQPENKSNEIVFLFTFLKKLSGTLKHFSLKFENGPRAKVFPIAWEWCHKIDLPHRSFENLVFV